MKDRYGDLERGGGEWEPIQILSEGDRGSNKMNSTSNTRLKLNYPSWSRPRSHWSAIDRRLTKVNSVDKIIRVNKPGWKPGASQALTYQAGEVEEGGRRRWGRGTRSSSAGGG
jgi:hypothetical protein